MRPILTPIEKCFEIFRQGKSKVLATAEDSYAKVVITAIPKELEKECVIYNFYGMQARFGCEYYIRKSDNYTIHMGYWMNFPEKHWGINKEEYRKLSVTARAQLEAEDQLTYWVHKYI
jgi:hypothetical protein